MKGFSLIELMIVVIIIGILASFAVPAYQQYLIKARVTEGLHLASPAKLKVSELILLNNELPKKQTRGNYVSAGTSENVKSIAIGEKGVITIAYTELAGNGTLLLKPNLAATGEIQWRCEGGTLPSIYRPANCR